MQCKICGKNCSTSRGFGCHLSYSHKMSSKDYYDKYLKKEDEGICLTCGKETPFLSIAKGYQKHCNPKCAAIDPNVQIKLKDTNMKKYGNEWSIASANSREKSKQTLKQKYNVEYPLQSKELLNKMIQTNLTNKGVKFNGQTKESKTKAKDTRIKKYGKFHSDLNLKKSHSKEARQKAIQKSKETCLNHFGVDSQFKVPEIQEKIKQTKLTRYNDEHYINIDKRNETIKKKYGVDNIQQVKEYNEKSLETKRNNYDLSNITNLGWETRINNVNLDNEINDADE